MDSDRKLTPVLQKDEYVDVGRFWQIVWKGKYWIAFWSLLVSGLVAVYVQFLVAPTYQAISTIKLATSQKSIIDFQSIASGFSGDALEVNTEAEVLRSRSLLRSVVLDLDLLNDPEFVEQEEEGSIFLEPVMDLLEPVMALLPKVPEIELTEEQQREAQIRSVVDTLLKTTGAFNIPQTYVFEIRARSENPQTAVKLADSIAEKYIENQINKKFSATEVASVWLSKRVSELAVTLEETEAELSKFSGSTNVLSSESVSGLERQLKELRERGQGTEAELQENRDYIAALEGAAGESRAQRAVIAENTQLNQLLKEGRDSTFDAAYKGLILRERRDMEATNARLTAINAGIARLEAEFTQQNQDLIQLSQLTRDVEASRLLYEHFLTRLKETSAQEGLQQPDSELLSHAVPPQGAVAPQKKRIVLLALIFSTMAAAGILILKDITKKTFSTIQEVESFTQGRLWGKIPLLPGRRVAPNVIYQKCQEDKTSPMTEAFRQFRTSVQFSSVLGQSTVVAVSSSLPGEGKTTTALVLAQQLSELGKKVLFIDADMRRFGAHRAFGIVHTNSLLDAIEDPQNIRNACPQKGDVTFDFLSGSRPVGNPADILSSQRFSEFLAYAKDAYDYVVIDTPPALLVSDARILFTYADVRLVVLRWNQTTRAQLRDTVDLLEKNTDPISGFLLNGLGDEEPGHYYGY